MTWWAWVLVLALPAGYLRLVAHELSHAVATDVSGGTVDWKRFRPWPHKTRDGWFWGRMYRSGGDELLVHVAPLGRATCFLLAWVGPALVWPPLWVFVFWELTDIVWWWVGWWWRPGSDGAKARGLLK
jgi:hypothetical protein